MIDVINKLKEIRNNGISININVPLENILAVGDSTSDWRFVELCGYGAAMKNASQRLKELVKTKEEG